METASLGQKTLLLIGASRGLGLAMAEEFLAHGWNVVGTVRGTARTGLHELAERRPGRIEIESLDINLQEQIGALRSRLAARISTHCLSAQASRTIRMKRSVRLRRRSLCASW